MSDGKIRHIASIPMVYRNTRFRSTLEADWAATFDMFGWHWEYEPVGVVLNDGAYYRPDFYLPTQRVWGEVKGPHDERVDKVDKTVQLQDSVGYDEWDWSSTLVVILRPPGPGDTLWWSGTRSDQDILMLLCSVCEHYGFMDHAGYWSCRRHAKTPQDENKPWRPSGALYRPGELPFIRAPRSNAKKAAG